MAGIAGEHPHQLAPSVGKLSAQGTSSAAPVTAATFVLASPTPSSSKDLVRCGSFEFTPRNEAPSPNPSELRGDMDATFGGVHFIVDSGGFLRLSGSGATYQRCMQAYLGKQIGWNIEVYIDDIVVKNRNAATLIDDMRETFDNLDCYKIKLNPKKCYFGVPGGQVLGYFISARGIEANPLKIKAVLDMEPPRTLQKATHSGTPEHKKKYDELKAIFEADLIGSFEKTRSHGIRDAGLDRSIIEHRLPEERISAVPAASTTMNAEILVEVKKEIEKMLDAGFIGTCRYAEWISNVVPVEKRMADGASP
ncbi:hypothetical protein QYE76_050762 [Lolium multiflorum]|uniref:Reverse transcriptase domain-containing protein n=1 Tax=Lolium multiflorum TaxID=4521 RepID=A0AAD8WJI8_LOLMU|nr:hypothetical protein QYE76_050762 [Lolium multiflorum]